MMLRGLDFTPIAHAGNQRWPPIRRTFSGTRGAHAGGANQRLRRCPCRAHGFRWLGRPCILRSSSSLFHGPMNGIPSHRRRGSSVPLRCSSSGAPSPTQPAMPPTSRQPDTARFFHTQKGPRRYSKEVPHYGDDKHGAEQPWMSTVS